MITSTLLQVGLSPQAVRSLLSPAFLAVLGLAIVMTVALYTERPRITRRFILGLVPWMIVGAALTSLAVAATYPPVVDPAVSGIGGFLTTYVVVTLLWFGILEVGRGASGGHRVPTYIGTMGVGAAYPVVTTLFLHANGLSGSRIIWLAVVPVVAAAVAAILMVTLGFTYPDTIAYTGMVGGLVVFGQALGAIGTPVAVVTGFGGHSTLSWTILGVVASTELDVMLGLDIQFIWMTGFIVVKLALALILVVALTGYTDRHPDRGNLLLGIGAGVGIVHGLTILLSTVVVA